MRGLKANRVFREITQEQLAEATGITALTISNLETRQTKRPQPAVRKKLEEYFNCRVNWLQTCGPKKVGCRSWEEVEGSLRNSILEIAGLPESDIHLAIKIAHRYLDTFETFTGPRPEVDDELNTYPVFKKH